jgi:hypothetical protein
MVEDWENIAYKGDPASPRGHSAGVTPTCRTPALPPASDSGQRRPSLRCATGCFPIGDNVAIPKWLGVASTSLLVDVATRRSMRLSRRRVTGWGAFNHSDLPLLVRENDNERVTEFEHLFLDEACMKQLSLISSIDAPWRRCGCWRHKAATAQNE